MALLLHSNAYWQIYTVINMAPSGLLNFIEIISIMYCFRVGLPQVSNYLNQFGFEEFTAYENPLSTSYFILC